jgi:hypothetical protein
MENLEISEMGPLDWIVNAGISMIPPILVGLLFYVIMRAIFRADATERRIYSEIEAEERAKRENSSNA